MFSNPVPSDSAPSTAASEASRCTNQLFSSHSTFSTLNSMPDNAEHFIMHHRIKYHSHLQLTDKETRLNEAVGPCQC